MNRLIFIVSVFVLVACANPKLEIKPEYYFGQNEPLQNPNLFAPNIISGSFDDRMIYFLNEGKECYFQLRGAPKSVVFFMELTENGWTAPKTAFFSGMYFEEFAFSQDGNILIYTSNQPKPDSIFTGEFYLWKSKRIKGNWTESKFLGEKFKGAGYPTIANSGNIYYFNKKENGFGENDIYFSRFLNGTYSEPEIMSEAINTKFHEVDPFIAPDESYLLYCSNEKEGESIYVSFKNEKGKWQKGISLGKEIGKGASICPTVSSDGKYLFFCSNRINFRTQNDEIISYKEKMKIMNHAGNGSNDIYWVNASVIEKAKNLD